MGSRKTSYDEKLPVEMICFKTLILSYIKKRKVMNEKDRSYMVDLKMYMLKITFEFFCVCRYVNVNGKSKVCPRIRREGQNGEVRI